MEIKFCELSVSWTADEGHYKIFLDGALNVEGFNLSRAVPIAGDGIFIVGQEQDNIGGPLRFPLKPSKFFTFSFSSGGFSESESFIGKISFLDFWNRKLNAIEISEYYRTCDPYQGNLYSWTDLKFKTVGDIKIHQSEFCKPCKQNLTVDNGVVIYGDQTAFVKCSEGFKIEGSPFVFCLRTSKWEVSKMPSCKIVKCSPLKTPSNGRLSLTKISFSGRAKFTCDDGFSLDGSDLITCMASGNWSDSVPHCKSIYECPALKKPSKGDLVYASDSGIIHENLEAYEIGTFVQVKCYEGFSIEGDNLVSCTDQGAWDFDVEDCQPDEEVATGKFPSEIVKISTEFWIEFKEFLFYSCTSTTVDATPKLCKRFPSDFGSNLSSFELPETKEYEGMDSKLSKLLKNTLDSKYIATMTVESFMSDLLQNSTIDSDMRDAFRFVICLYIDLIVLDDELYDETSSEDLDKTSENINENIKKMIKQIALPIYKNQLQS